jgi:putative hemolysin
VTTTVRPEADRPLAHAALIPPLDERSGSYRLRFARTENDLEEVRRVRFRVFNLELGEGFESAYETGLDKDEYDQQCQHLMVEHIGLGETIGTYRMQVADAAKAGMGFYAAGEFDLSMLPKSLIHDSIELGRACIVKEHRDHKVLFLLWRGLSAYALHTGRRKLFGCSSLTSQDMSEGLRLYEQLIQEGHIHPTLRLDPHESHRCKAESLTGPRVKTPKLFKTYLRHGAKILGPPAIDREFRTIDYLTLVEVTEEQLAFFTGKRGS